MATQEEFPLTRVVLFGDTVYKLKYKISEKSASSGLSISVQKDIERITQGILVILQMSGQLNPMSSDRVVLFPSCTSWSTGKTYQVFEGEKELNVYPLTIILVISLLSDNNVHVPVVHNEKVVRTENVHASTPKSRKRPIQDISHDEITTSDYPTVKKFKPEILPNKRKPGQFNKKVMHKRGGRTSQVASSDSWWSRLVNFLFKPFGSS